MPQVEGSAITNNVAKRGSGGGISVFGSVANIGIRASRLSGNVAEGWCCSDQARLGGGGVFVYGAVGNISLTASTLQENRAAPYGYGGAILIGGDLESFAADGLVAAQNTAYSGGLLAVTKAQSQMRFLNVSASQLLGNSASSQGGRMREAHATWTLHTCTARAAQV